MYLLYLPCSYCGGTTCAPKASPSARALDLILAHKVQHTTPGIFCFFLLLPFSFSTKLYPSVDKHAILNNSLLDPTSPSSYCFISLCLFFCQTPHKNSLYSMCLNPPFSFSFRLLLLLYFLQMILIPLISIYLNQWSVLNPYLLELTALFNQSLFLNILSSLAL